MGQPRISVVIPTYNNAQFIGTAIDSVVSQTLSPHEIIVVDDGSIDNTGDVLASFGERIIVLRQSNSGPATARNAGIRAATGDWVAFLDADDYWFPNKLELQVPHLLEEVVQVGGHHHLEKEDPAPVTRLTTSDFLTRMPWGICSHVARRSALLRVGGFNDEHRHPGAEDRELYLRLSLSGTSLRINRHMFHYRQHANQGSRVADRMASSYGRVLDRFFSEHPEYLRSAPAAYAYFHLDTAWAHYAEGQRRQAARHLLASLYAHPSPLARASRGRMALRVALGETLVRKRPPG